MDIVNKIAEKIGLEFRAEEAPPNLPKGEEAVLPSFGGDGGGSKPLWQTANPDTYIFAKEFQKRLKQSPTPAEKALWSFLRNKQTGLKIRKQHIIDKFIVDFVCLSRKLVIEIDGKSHDFQKDYDEARSQKLKELNFDVIRFSNNEVMSNPAGIAARISEILSSREEKTSEDDEQYSSTHHPSIGGEGGGFTPLDLIDYIYAVLHSPSYREKYKEFLKIDFPRVPYPESAETFWKLVEKGSILRGLHLMESPILDKLITTYPETGNNEMVKVKFEETEEGKGNVRINEKQYFGGVPKTAWEFYIGGYQPAQKWLKDRAGRLLTFDDILHYQRVIVALVETARVMGEIDGVM